MNRCPSIPHVPNPLPRSLRPPFSADRSDFLDRECGGDAELRARVEALLAVEDRAGPVPNPDATMAFEPTSLETLAGTQIAISETPSGPDPTAVTGRPRSKLRRLTDTRASPSTHVPRGFALGPNPRWPVHAAQRSSAKAAWVRRPGRTDRTGGNAGHAEMTKLGMDSRAILGLGSTPNAKLWALMDQSEHRPRLRRGHHRTRPAVLCDGTGERP